MNDNINNKFIKLVKFLNCVGIVPVNWLKEKYLT